MTMICAVPDEDAPEVADEEPPEDALPTLSPIAMFTRATVPVIGEVWTPQSGQSGHP